MNDEELNYAGTLPEVTVTAKITFLFLIFIT